MTKKKVTKWEYSFTEEEVKLIRKCIEYALHRLTKHEECGLTGVVNEEKVEQLVDGLRERA